MGLSASLRSCCLLVDLNAISVLLRKSFLVSMNLNTFHTFSLSDSGICSHVDNLDPSGVEFCAVWWIGIPLNPVWHLAIQSVFLASLSKSGVHRCVGLSGPSVQFHWSMCMFLCQYLAGSITIALQYNLKFGIVKLLPVFVCIIILAILDFLCFHV